MIKYCEELFECRRVMQLKYFGEKFNPKHCGKSCDNCQNSDKKAEVLNLYEEGLKII